MGKCQARLLSHPPAADVDAAAAALKADLTMDASDSDGEEAAAPVPPAPPHALSLLQHEDILLSILGYVADVPFEMVDKARSPTDSHSTLTHILPLVSWQFHRLTRGHDLYWKQALLRMVKDEPSLWEEGMKKLIFEAKCDELRTEMMERNRNRARRGKRTKESQLIDPPQSQPEAEGKTSSSAADTSATSTVPPPTKEEALLQEACAAIESHPPTHHTTTSSGMHQCLYQSIVLRHLRYQASVFHMPSSVSIGTPYGLHFFEPRYRLLISEVMANYSVSARRGESIIPNVPGLFPPRQGQIIPGDMKASLLNLLEENESVLANNHMPSFIHAHQRPLRRDTPAAIVQVAHCMIQPDGSADVFLMPMGYIWIEEIWERPGTGGLYEARGIRMGKEASKSYERWCGMSAFGAGDGRGRGQMLPIP
ncbi:hypothetical protein ACHAXT_003045 [Thalassiosira profunda]